MEDGKKHRESQPSVSLNFNWEARNSYTKKKKKNTFKHNPLGKRVEEKHSETFIMILSLDETGSMFYLYISEFSFVNIYYWLSFLKIILKRNCATTCSD